jgi:hypothetical protein
MVVKHKKKKNQWLHLLITIVIPAAILSKLSGEAYLGNVWWLIVALSFPIGYGLRDWYYERKIDLLAGVGLVSILLTGGIGLLQLDNDWLVVKETAVPLIIGLIVMISLLMKRSLVDAFLWQVLDKDRIYDHADDDQRNAIARLFRTVGRWFVWSFWFSALLNFVLTKMIVTAATGTELFNQQLGANTVWTFVAIVVPTFIMLTAVIVRLVNRLEKITGLGFEALIKKS